MQTYLDLLRKTARQQQNIICLGIDPVIEEIPLKEDDQEKKIVMFYVTILDACAKQKLLPAAVKPNSAFFEQYGIPGMKALQAIIKKCKSLSLPVILDNKRGDIAKTAAAYARASFLVHEADAVTLSPYMGYDVVEPYLQYLQQGKGAYMLCKTSNKTAATIQDLELKNNKKLYEMVAEQIITWHQPGLGVVIGATFPKELELLSKQFSDSKKEISLLIPGVGTQGGSLKETLHILKTTTTDMNIHRINVSSAVANAWQKNKTKHFADAAVDKLKELIMITRQYLS